MTRILTLFLVIVLTALPVSAEQPLSATEIENLPFDSSLANTPNTETVTQTETVETAKEKKAAKTAKKTPTSLLGI